MTYLFQALRVATLGISGLAASTTTLSAADDGDIASLEGRWIPAGTFAISDLPNNELRVRSYANARQERNRVATFLPGMTIVYQIAPSDTRSDFVNGVTHSGIPVQVLESELSTGKFKDKIAKDVVIHRSHLACRTLACDQQVQIGIGDAFSIAREDNEEIELLNTNELRITYSLSEFADRETNGYLTLHKDRQNPRWSIFDGYASKLSTACGQKRSPGEPGQSHHRITIYF